jgi:predicted nucleotidyltransferase
MLAVDRHMRNASVPGDPVPAKTLAASAPLVRARAIAEHFSLQDRVLAVAVFGSVARGAASHWSDIDLLVLVGDGAPSRLKLVSGLPSHLRVSHLTVLCYRPDELSRLMAYGTSFTSHLRREARVMVDPAGQLGALLATSPREDVPVRDELDAEMSQLEAYQHLDVFRGNYLFVLGRLYAVGKAVVMLGLHADGEPTFDRNEAFAEFRRRHPETADSIDAIRRLQPFYMYVTRRADNSFPFSYRNCAPKVVESIAAIRVLAAAVR